jgi:hypothetical protein
MLANTGFILHHLPWCLPTWAYAVVNESHGQPRSRANCSTAIFPPLAQGLTPSTFRLNVSTASSTDMFQPSFIEANHTLDGVSDRNVSG